MENSISRAELEHLEKKKRIRKAQQRQWLVTGTSKRLQRIR
jgi:hypothetical protein